MFVKLSRLRFSLNSWSGRGFSCSSHRLEAYHFRGKRNYYDVLGVKRSCSLKEIKAAYFSLSKEFHPDSAGSADGEKNLASKNVQFLEINEAYSVLSKDKERREYDESLQFEERYSDRANPGANPGANSSYGSNPFHRSRENMSQDEFARDFYRQQFEEYMRQRQRMSYERYYRYQNRYNRGPFGPHERPFSEQDFQDYYGIKGVKRVPNFSIVLLCLSLMSFGFFLHILQGVQVQINLDEANLRSQQYGAHLEAARERALDLRKQQEMDAFVKRFAKPVDGGN